MFEGSNDKSSVLWVVSMLIIIFTNNISELIYLYFLVRLFTKMYILKMALSTNGMCFIYRLYPSGVRIDYDMITITNIQQHIEITLILHPF